MSDDPTCPERHDNEIVKRWAQVLLISSQDQVVWREELWHVCVLCGDARLLVDGFGKVPRP